ncbi:MAG: hypothetical protein ACI8P9_001706 [Parasphingorhabdus sp.]|jgi:hypothetical protein
MSKAQCLCGDVSWQYTGQPTSAYHCHCAMCRKAHGASFATYYFVNADQFSWLGDTVSIVDYQSSPTLTRCFCGKCGSVVPNIEDDGSSVFIPAGNHTTGHPVQGHIFTASKAPWFNITDNLPQHLAYTPEDGDLPVYDKSPKDPSVADTLRGSCLCGGVTFRLTEPFKIVRNCFCERCRRARSAAHTTNGFTSDEALIFTSGEDKIKTYKIPDAQFFTHAFCEDCGSGVPRIDANRKIAITPLGALDDDPGECRIENIFTAYKPEWFELTDSLPTFAEGPG